ncbi:MAG: hypothetical protein LBC70_03675 [Chitinispirillales bacterium]|jgi:hypothetical protein|nr:hypothetical protein [Chitinispirillales bacterium]
MNMNGIGNSTASWAQFVKLTQAARDRNNGGFSVENTGAANTSKQASAPKMTQDINAISFKRVADVYSSVNQSAQTMHMQSAASLIMDQIQRKVVGGKFDAYA